MAVPQGHRLRVLDLITTCTHLGLGCKVRVSGPLPLRCLMCLFLALTAMVIMVTWHEQLRCNSSIHSRRSGTVHLASRTANGRSLLWTQYCALKPQHLQRSTIGPQE